MVYKVTSRFVSFSIMVFCLLFMLPACSDDEEEDRSQFVGSWYGTRYYNNPVSGIKYQYLTIELKGDGSGRLEYESSASISIAYFRWSVNGGYIDCVGAYASSYGEADTDFSLRLRISGNRLLPENQFNVFILTRDASIVTDGDGNEAPDPDQLADLLFGIWITTDGTVVINLESSGAFQEYTLSSPYAKTYSSKTEGDFYYRPLEKKLQINTSYWDVLELTQSNLKISNGSRSISYNRGSTSNIPTTVDLSKYLASVWTWTTSDDKYTFRFTDDGTVVYFEWSEKERLYLSASGKFTATSNKINCSFTRVNWDYGTSTNKYSFPGWVCDQPCTKTYIIEVLYSSLRMTLPDGTIIYLYES